MTDVHSAARHWYPCDIELAIQATREKISEWDYVSDPHGYCHDRSTLVALVSEIDRLRATESPTQFTCPVCGAHSAHPEDKRTGYCGACHAFTGRGTSGGTDA